MKYLIVSDIHGSLPALQQVLEFYKREACDMLCLLGEVALYGNFDYVELLMNLR